MGNAHSTGPECALPIHAPGGAIMQHTWKFITRWNVRTPGALHGTIEETHARAWAIVADSQLDAMTAYCALPWVQDIDYDQFDSLTITMWD